MSACACMGPMYGEPLCYCRMVAGNHPLNTVAREAEEKRSRIQMAALFAPGGIWYRPQKPKLPANARILVSRNKREGRYGGRLWRRNSDEAYYIGECGSRHCRESNSCEGALRDRGMP